eukprot:tig00000178_g12712.t1
MNFPFPEDGLWSLGDRGCEGDACKGWGWPRGISNVWAGRPKSAPFDQKFYLIINLAVGGTNGYWDAFDGKPWSNDAKRPAAAPETLRRGPLAPVASLLSPYSCSKVSFVSFERREAGGGRGVNAEYFSLLAEGLVRGGDVDPPQSAGALCLFQEKDAGSGKGGELHWLVDAKVPREVAVLCGWAMGMCLSLPAQPQHVLPLSLPAPFYAYLLGKRGEPDFTLLQEVEPVLARNLKEADYASDACEFYFVSIRDGAELVPGGAERRVTPENKARRRWAVS